MAMTARWRMPPENWCGYCRARPAGSAMSTSRRSSTARAPRLARREAAMRDLALDDLAADRQHRVQRRRRVLEDEADILAAQVPQALGHRADDFRRRRGRSTPRPAPCPAEARRWRAQATLLPEPDSPTMPSTSFGWTRRRSMPRTAGTGRPEPANVTSRARTDRTGSAVRPSLAPPPAGARAH